MSKGEKLFCVFYLAYILVYITAFIILAVTKRALPNPNQKVTWTILISMFWPNVFVYLPLHGFRPRQQQQEKGPALRMGSDQQSLTGFLVALSLVYALRTQAMKKIAVREAAPLSRGISARS